MDPEPRRLWSFRPAFARRDGGPSLWLDRLLRGEAPLSDDLEARLRARQVDAINRLRIPLMASNVLNAGAFLLQTHLSGQVSTLATVWSLAAMLMAGMAMTRAWMDRGRPPPQRASRRAVARIVRSAAIFGLFWAIPGLFLLPYLTGTALAFSAALLTGMIAGGAIALYPIPAAALVYMLPVALSGVVGAALAHGWEALGIAALAVTFLGIFVGVIHRHASLFTSEFVARLDLEARNRLIEDLLEDTRLEALGARQLSDVRQATAQRRQAVGVLATGIAHSFNALLTAIRGNAELARARNADPTLIDPILDSCDSGAAQVRQLLAIGQKQALRPQTADLAALLEQFERVAAVLLAPGIRLRSLADAGLWRAHVDVAGLEGALSCLVMNARDALPHGGTITITLRNAPRALAGGADAVRLTVIDDGTGMDAATRSRATDPFFTTQRLGTGKGLGLSAAAGFAEQSGGRIEIDSTPGAGTRVSLLVPVPARATVEARSRSVLVVDADAVALDQVVTGLRALGCQVETAGSAEAAMSRLAGPPRFDLVLLAMLLHGATSGLRLRREILRRNPGITVLLMSDIPPPGGSHIGAILARPVTADSLAACLNQAVPQPSDSG